MAMVAKVWIGSVFVNGGGQGFSHRHYLKANSWDSAKALCKRIAEWRATLLPSNFEVTYARVSESGRETNSKACINGPIQPLDDGTPAAVEDGFGLDNKVEDALLFRFETESGRYGMQMLRALPDVQVTDDEFTSVYAEQTTPDATIPTLATTTWLACLKNYLAYLRVNTLHARKVAGGTSPRWETEDWETIYFRRTAKRDTGRPFGTPRGRQAG